MKSLRAERIKVNIGGIWESPVLHVLVTKEDDVFVARCLDFTVSSHGTSVKDALNSLGACVKEYILTAIENDSTNTIFDPAHSRYWRMFNELETKQTAGRLKRSLRESSGSISYKHMEQAPAEISHA